MEFTREPVVETIISPKEGYKLVIRNSKGPGHEEHFVDAIEIISFGSALFFRSLEKPKAFVLPVSDYEVLEVREAKMIFKHPQQDKSSKQTQKVITESSTSDQSASKNADQQKEDKRKERRKNTRRKRKEIPNKAAQAPVDSEQSAAKTQDLTDAKQKEVPEKIISSSLNDVLKPPAKLIRDSVPSPQEQEVMEETVKAMEAMQAKEAEKLMDTTFFSDNAEPQTVSEEALPVVVEDSAETISSSELPPEKEVKEEAPKPKRRPRTPRRRAPVKKIVEPKESVSVDESTVKVAAQNTEADADSTKEKKQKAESKPLNEEAAADIKAERVELIEKLLPKSKTTKSEEVSDSKETVPSQPIKVDILDES